MPDENGFDAPRRPASGIYTETLARLYMRQGFFDQALAIYRHLAQAQPENGELRTRLAALEQQWAAATAEQGAGASGAVLAGPVKLGLGRDLDLAQRLIDHLERWLRHLRQQRTV
jgi:hypothetical protein